MYLVYHIDECLGIFSLEVVDHVFLIFTREDRLDQGGKLVQGEHPSNQTFTS